MPASSNETHGSARRAESDVGRCDSPSDRPGVKPLPSDRDLLLAIRMEAKRVIDWASQTVDAHGLLLEVLLPSRNGRSHVVKTRVGSKVLQSYEESHANPLPSIDPDLLNYISLSSQEVCELVACMKRLVKGRLILRDIDLQKGCSAKFLEESRDLAWAAHCLLKHFRQLDRMVQDEVILLARPAVHSSQEHPAQPPWEASLKREQSTVSPAIRVETIGGSHLVFVGDRLCRAVDDQAAAFILAIIALGNDYVTFAELQAHTMELEGGHQTRIWASFRTR